MKEGATLTMHVYKKKTDRKRKILIVSADFVTTELIYAGNRSQRYDLLTCHQNTIQIFTTRKSRGSGNH